MSIESENSFNILQKALFQIFSNGDVAIPLRSWVNTTIEIKISESGLTTTEGLIANENISLDNKSYNIAAFLPIEITLNADPNENTLLRIANASNGNVLISGNGKLIYGQASLTLYDGESVVLVFLNNVWNIM